MEQRETQWRADEESRQTTLRQQQKREVEDHAYFENLLARYVAGSISLDDARAYARGYASQLFGRYMPGHDDLGVLFRFMSEYREGNRYCWLCCASCFAHRRCEVCGAPWYDPTRRRWWQFWRGAAVAPRK